MWTPTLVTGSIPFWTIAGFVFGAGFFGYMSQPQMHIRIMSSKDRVNLFSTLPLVVAIQTLLVVGVLWGATSARVLFPDGIEEGASLANVKLLSESLPTVAAGIVLAAIMAAIMTTVDSLLVLASGSISEDILNQSLEREFSEKQLVRSSQLSVVTVAVIAGYLAINSFEIIFWIAEWSWGLLTAFGPPVIFGLYWKKATREGAIAGFIVAAITAILWGTPGLISAYEAVHMSLPTYVFGAITLIGVSLVTKDPPEDVQRSVERANASAPIDILPERLGDDRAPTDD